ncbi:MAG: GDP-L-fucose synthase [Bryobacterales bacterium]|nr:GDP-L-fucose synthase [Bryobacterales bacterium]
MHELHSVRYVASTAAIPLDAPIYVAGHRGLVGSALTRKLQAEGFQNILTPSRHELDLTNAQEVEHFFATRQPKYVFLAAAKVGGILANHHCPADFARDNLLIATHVIHASWKYGVRKLLFLGSSCIYPKFAEQPIREEALMTGALEPTNSAYAVAKIAGIELCKAYRRQHGFASISLMPTNLYGPGDNFHPEHSHVIPGLLRRFHEAKVARKPSVCTWGSGQPRREFLHVDDLADACLFAMRRYDSPEPLNIGCGEDLTIAELVETIRDVVGFKGNIAWDPSKPDGTPRKVLDVSRLQSLGWKPRIKLRAGLEATYDWYCAQAGTTDNREATKSETVGK